MDDAGRILDVGVRRTSDLEERAAGLLQMLTVNVPIAAHPLELSPEPE